MPRKIRKIAPMSKTTDQPTIAMSQDISSSQQDSERGLGGRANPQGVPCRTCKVKGHIVSLREILAGKKRFLRSIAARYLWVAYSSTFDAVSEFNT